MKGNMIGGWAFIAGVVIAILVGALGSLNTTWVAVLVILGIVIGLLNVTTREVTPFLLASVALIIAASFGGEVLNVIKTLEGVLKAILALVVPAVIIVSLREVFGLAKG